MAVLGGASVGFRVQGSMFRTCWGGGLSLVGGKQWLKFYRTSYALKFFHDGESESCKKTRCAWSRSWHQSITDTMNVTCGSLISVQASGLLDRENRRSYVQAIHHSPSYLLFWMTQAFHDMLVFRMLA